MMFQIIKLSDSKPEQNQKPNNTCPGDRQHFSTGNRLISVSFNYLIKYLLVLVGGVPFLGCLKKSNRGASRSQQMIFLKKS
jgi:hypothetical protein